jgi:GNAT superfamily N-acetyltransferase
MRGPRRLARGVDRLANRMHDADRLESRARAERIEVERFLIDVVLPIERDACDRVPVARQRLLRLEVPDAAAGKGRGAELVGADALVLRRVDRHEPELDAIVTMDLERRDREEPVREEVVRVRRERREHHRERTADRREQQIAIAGQRAMIERARRATKPQRHAEHVEVLELLLPQRARAADQDAPGEVGAEVRERPPDDRLAAPDEHDAARVERPRSPKTADRSDHGRQGLADRRADALAYLHGRKSCKRLAMFVDVAVAKRIDRAESRLGRAVASVIEGARIVDVDGGISAYARPGSPVNKMIGIGFDGPVDLAAAEAIWEETPRLEASTLASPEFFAQLPYQLVGFEHVLVRQLSDLPPRTHEVTTGDEALWMSGLVEGFAAGDGTGAVVDNYARDAIEQVMRDFGRATGFLRYACALDGTPAGAATLRIDDGIAILAGAATLPAMRRRGVQAALLAARLHDAREAGCELATITTAPGSLSQKNAMKSGFTLAYARAVLQRPERG